MIMTSENIVAHQLTSRVGLISSLVCMAGGLSGYMARDVNISMILKRQPTHKAIQNVLHVCVARCGEILKCSGYGVYGVYGVYMEPMRTKMIDEG